MYKFGAFFNDFQDGLEWSTPTQSSHTPNKTSQSTCWSTTFRARDAHIQRKSKTCEYQGIQALHFCSVSGVLPLSGILPSGPVLISYLSSFLPSHIFSLADQNEPLEQWINHPFPSGQSHLEWNKKSDSF